MSLVASSPKLTRAQYWTRTLLWFALLLLALELFSRFVMFKAPTRIEDSVWGTVPPDNSCYTRGTEGFGVTCYFAKSEIGTPFRGQAETSIVVLGDSYTESTQVSNDRKYVSLAETSLRERGYDVDLHNLGDSNRILADFVYLAPAVIETYSPQIVVVQTNPLGLRDSLNPRRKNHFAANADGSLQLVHRDLGEENLLLRNLALSSGLATFSAFRWNRVMDTFQPAAEEDNRPSATSEQIEAEIQLLFSAYPESKIVLLIMPNVPELTVTGELVWDNPEDDALLAALSVVEDLTVIYPAEAFRELYDSQYIFPRGFENSLPNVGHLNRYGHIAVAETLANALEALLK
ncbi:MAG: hypothetical protein AB1750_05315 [Chloroflexota bacterium]